MLTDRAYIGEIQFKGQWYPGKQEPLVDRATWDRVQALLGEKIYHAHQMTYAAEFMTCGHCGRAVTGEQIIKRSKAGEKRYVYYRCSGYLAKGHPRVRVTEPEAERQVLALFGRMKVEDPEIRDWFRAVLAAQTHDAQADSRAQREELTRQASLLVAQQDRLLNLRLSEAVDHDTFAKKHTELRDRLSSIKLQLDVLDRSHDETAELASKVFELSQTLQNKWETADYSVKRRILEIVCLNCRLDGETLVFSERKPFDVLSKGLDLSKSQGDRIRTCGLVDPNHTLYQAELHPGRAIVGRWSGMDILDVRIPVNALCDGRFTDRPGATCGAKDTRCLRRVRTVTRSVVRIITVRTYRCRDAAFSDTAADAC